MMLIELPAIVAVVLAALAILPGTLGILMYTNSMASTPRGARLIYRHSFWLLILSVILISAAAYQAVQAGQYSLWFTGSVLVYTGILVFGFLMHTRFLFKPVRKPEFITLDRAIERFGGDEEVVGVLDEKGRPWAFIARLARRPHIVYQPEGDAPFIMSHCILAHSSMAYAMADRFRQPDITITSALANNLVFYESSSQCSVVQIQNRSRDGKLPLKTIPTVVVSLGAWQKLYPDSPVWVRDREWRDIFYLKLLSRADVIDPGSDVVVYPLQNPVDGRLPMKSLVNGVEINGECKAYPNSLFSEQGYRLVEDEVGGEPILVASAFAGDYNQVFSRKVGEKVLTFTPERDSDGFRDNETGSRWDPTGKCVEGSYQDTRLKPVPHYNKMFWYVWSDFHPGTGIYMPQDTTQRSVA